MQEKRVRFASGAIELEGLYCEGQNAAAVAITHPHPLYGGDMLNPVVEAIATAYQRCGFATLRFNFRGTGNSTGTHDQGEGEKDDVRAALDFLHNRNFADVHLSGYSFGAWVNALAMQSGLDVPATTMVAPPVAFIEFPEMIRLPALVRIIAGSEDEIAPPALIEPQMQLWNPSTRMDVIHGADHFFFGFLDDVSRLLIDVIR